MKLRVIRGRPVVSDVYVNGHGPYRFLVDTGTTMNHLDPALAELIGLQPTFQTELMSSTGVTRAPGSDGITVAIDSVQADGQTFLFAGLDVIQRRFPDVQGVLGQVFLSRRRQRKRWHPFRPSRVAPSLPPTSAR
jgi:predicted aspartyl protease